MVIAPLTYLSSLVRNIEASRKMRRVFRRDFKFDRSQRLSIEGRSNHFSASYCPPASRKGPGSGIVQVIIIKRTDVAKPNYQYEKRQRELEKKKKKAEKAHKKSGPGDAAPMDEGETGTETAPTSAPTPPDAAATS
jgi:hypothetical protein